MSTRKRNQKPQKPSSHYWIYGWHAAVAALQNPERDIRQVFATRNVAVRLSEMNMPIGIQETTPEQLAKRVGEDAVHQGIAVEVAPLPEPNWQGLLDCGKPLVLLDQITDPHNVGAILRTAAAFDIGAVIAPKDHAAPENGVMAKSASGGLEVVPYITVTNLAATMAELKEAHYWLAGLDGHAKQTLSQATLGNDTALVLGAEGKGLRRLTREACDLLITIPMSPQMESLNVSNAAAIAFHHLFSLRS